MLAVGGVLAEKTPSVDSVFGAESPQVGQRSRLSAAHSVVPLFTLPTTYLWTEFFHVMNSIVSSIPVADTLRDVFMFSNAICC